MAAIGGLAGVAIFCVCEVLPHTRRRRTRQALSRNKHSFALLRQRLFTRAQSYFGGTLGKQFGEIIGVEGLSALMMTYLRIKDSCILSGTCVAMKMVAREMSLQPFFYIFGGECLNPKSAERLDIWTAREWEEVEPLRRDRFGGAGVAVAGLFFVCGGTNGHGALSSVDCFDVESGQWTNIPSMQNRRIWPFACAIAGTLLVCGGKHEEESLNSAECFDLNSGEWEAIEAMSEARHGASGGSMHGLMFVCGGLQSSDELNAVELFNTTSGTWAEMDPMLSKRGWAAGAVLGNYLYICGGRCDGMALTSVERYDFDYEFWEIILAKMSLGRYGAVGGITKGSVYVFGGRSDSVSGAPQVVQTTEMLDISKNRWVAAEPMRQARAWSCGALLTARPSTPERSS